MTEKSLTFKKGTGNVKHNNREETFERDNIDISRKENNITIVKEDLKELYKNEFSQATEDYNNKPKKSGKKKTKNEQKGDYYQEIKKNKNGQKLYYELVIQIGDMNDTNCSGNTENEVAILTKYAEEFLVRFPNLKVFNAVIHMDEETPHLHIDYVPVAENCKRGISKQNSQTKAFEQIYQNETPPPKAEEAQKLFFKREREHLKAKMLEKFITPKVEKESHGDFTVDEYKFLAKQCVRDRDHVLSKISKEIDFKFPPVPFTKDKFIITSNQISDIKNFVYAGEQNVIKNEYEIKRLKEEMVVVERSRDYFKETNLSMKYKQKDLLLEELKKQLENKNAELQIIKNTPNAELENAKKKIKELELAARQKKEQEELKAKEYENKKLDRLKQKEFQDNKNIRLEKYDTHFIDMIKTNATELFEIEFEDFTKGSYLKKNDFEDLVDNVVNKLKEMYKDFADLFNYKNLNGVECNLIVEVVDIVAEQYEEYKQKTTSRERQ